ncbi:hypothetical protein Zmor_006472 [Zophobas morio]|uniref:DUF4817 domain-containing protein n=1 Tax=Zophobas morio TaxID=2755281 RepID=A0AA38IQ76_9CUCU|nr:hypothetical protein Zmor_006472 [Zophobas morio]
MALFSNIKYTDIVLVYGAAQRNGIRVQRIFSESLPNRRLPNIHTLQHLQEYGSFKLAAQDRGRLCSNRIANTEEAVLKSVETRRGTSTYVSLDCIGE